MARNRCHAVARLKRPAAAISCLLPPPSGVNPDRSGQAPCIRQTPMARASCCFRQALSEELCRKCGLTFIQPAQRKLMTGCRRNSHRCESGGCASVLAKQRPSGCVQPPNSGAIVMALIRLCRLRREILPQGSQQDEARRRLLDLSAGRHELNSAVVNGERWRNHVAAYVRCQD